MGATQYLAKDVALALLEVHPFAPFLMAAGTSALAVVVLSFLYKMPADASCHEIPSVVQDHPVSLGDALLN